VTLLMFALSANLGGAQASDRQDAGEPLLLEADADAGAPAAVPAQRGLDVADLDLDSLLNQTVVSSTKSAVRGAEAPAVITIVTAEEIAARGYTSLADVLKGVPGLYDVYDGVTHNIGVRGINGGARASGNVLAVMIDGHRVDFRPTTGNFFGEELIPLEVVERVEIIRGPASALYGANAYLGVINVITRTGLGYGGVRVSASGLLVRDHPGFGVGLSVGGGDERADFLVAASGWYLDRSGLTLPSSSPVLSRPSGAELDGKPSASDTARPKSLFARAGVALGPGRLSFFASVQNLDAAGEFQDFAPLSHGTRINLLNQNYWLQYEVSPTDRFSLKASVSYLNAGPADGEHLSIGRTDYDLLRRVGVNGVGGEIEGRYQLSARRSFTAGIDATGEDHLLQTFDQHQLTPVTTPEGVVLKSPGTITEGEGHGARKTFLNFGAFAQAVWGLFDAWSLVGGARVDVHNIYGPNPSFRAGVVYAPAAGNLSVKVLYGSSFKAPSAEQLYTQPMKLLDIRGNADLRAQTAHTFEVSFTRALSSYGELSVNAFVLGAIGRVEYVQRGLYLEAENLIDAWVVGGELEARVLATSSTTVRLSTSVARTVSQRVAAGSDQPLNALFPWLQGQAAVDQALPVLGLKVSLQLFAVGPRAASQSNALLNGSNYELGPYLAGAAAISLPQARLLGDRITHVSLRVSNAFTSYRTEAGSGGIDLPAQGVTGTLTITQQL
jgi:iron complex outermembrane receptor protein